MISIKSSNEIIKIKKAGEILAKVKDRIVNLVRPGITTLELDSIAHKMILELGGKPSFLGYFGYPNVICTSVNENLIHSIPNEYQLKDGDLLSIDFGVSYQGYHADSAITISVGKQTTENKKMISVAKEAFFVAFDLIKPGVKTGDLGQAIEDFVKRNGMYVPKNFAGHGIGKKLHEEPIIFNYGIKDTGVVLKDGMTICIEPMIMQGTQDVEILEDGWTVQSKSMKKTSHFEHTILIENGKPTILTRGENE